MIFNTFSSGSEYCFEGVDMSENGKAIPNWWKINLEVSLVKADFATRSFSRFLALKAWRIRVSATLNESAGQFLISERAFVVRLRVFFLPLANSQFLIGDLLACRPFVTKSA